MDVKFLESSTARTVSLYMGGWLTLALSVSSRMTQAKSVPVHGSQ